MITLRFILWCIKLHIKHFIYGHSKEYKKQLGLKYRIERIPFIDKQGYTTYMTMFHKLKDKEGI